MVHAMDCSTTATATACGTTVKAFGNQNWGSHLGTVALLKKLDEAFHFSLWTSSRQVIYMLKRFKSCENELNFMGHPNMA